MTVPRKKPPPPGASARRKSPPKSPTAEMGTRADGTPQRLQKIIAAAGLASRRKAEELILDGRVQVNGQVITELGAKADPERDHIRVDGKLLHGAERPRYFMLNKPKGYITTLSDPEKRPTVMKFFERTGVRVFPVGRLDYLSEGLLLMTNDGAMANSLTRAGARIEKTYLVKVSGQPTEAAVDQLRRGIMIERGKPGSGEGRILTEPARIRQMREAENPWYEVVLIEGRNRQIRKLFEEIGHHVEKIRRVGYGPLVLDLEPGEMRELDAQEVAGLQHLARRSRKPQGSVPPSIQPPRALRKVEEKNLPTARPRRRPQQRRVSGSPRRRPAS
ncbi:MAG: pseudouridine synthase [Acidobacteriaceae bacterium]